MILRRVVEAFGADYVQWRALTRVMLKSDFRSVAGVSMGRTQQRIWTVFAMYALFGLGIAVSTAFVAVLLPEIVLAGTVWLTQVSVLLAMAVLLEFQAVIISPDDYDVLAHQPVSSSTYFLVKLTNVLIFTLIIAGLLGGPSVIILIASFGPLVAGGGLVALAGVAVCTTLGILCVYTALLGAVSPRRLKRVLSTFQVVAPAAVLFAPFSINHFLGPGLEQLVLGDGVVTRSAWVLLVPPAWFASFLPLLEGDWGLGYVAAAAGGVVSLWVLFFIAGQRLSLSYAERLGAIAATDRDRKPSANGQRARMLRPGRAVRARFSARPRTRVVVTLLRGQFRDDMTFRLSVLSWAPIVFALAVVAISSGPLVDPFVGHGGWVGMTSLALAVIGPAVGVADQLPSSRYWRAAWVFFGAPARRAPLIVNAGLLVTLFLAVPSALVIGGVLVWAFGNLWHAVTHALVLALLAHLAVQARLWAGPDLPFSRPPVKGSRLAPVTMVAGIATIFLPSMLRVVYSGPLITVVFIGCLSFAAVVAPGVVQRAIHARVERLEFAG